MRFYFLYFAEKSVYNTINNRKVSFYFKLVILNYMSKNILAIGEVLFDVLPDGSKLGGAPANFAWYTHQFGFKDFVISAVGDDAAGADIIKCLKNLGINTCAIDILRGEKTGIVNITLDSASVPSYEIVKNVAWDKITCGEDKLALARKADVICFGSLAQRGEVSRRAINAILDNAPKHCLKIFDINLRQSFYSFEIIDSSLKKADILKISDEELPKTAQALDMPYSSDEAFCLLLLKQYGLDIIVLTRGEKGSIIFTKDNMYKSAGFKAEKLADTVGAGDSFSAAFCAGLLKGLDFKTIGERANKVASYVCTQNGAMAVLAKDLLF